MRKEPLETFELFVTLFFFSFATGNPMKKGFLTSLRFVVPVIIII